MAKAATKASASSNLLDRIIKSSTTAHTSILSESVLFSDKDVISTGIPIIDIAFSGDLDGGIQSGLTLFAGPSKTFKSLLSLLCLKAFLDKYESGIGILYDSEGGVTPEYLVSMGIDPSRVVHVPIEHIEMLKYDIVRQLKELKRDDKVLIIIDSIGNTASLKELEDALAEKTKAEMQRAKAIKGLFRMVTPSLVAKDIPCIAICHTYEEMSMYPRQIISGGTGLIYSATQAFIIGKAQEKTGTGTVKTLVGYNFTLNVEKSRHVKEKSKLPFQVTYSGGVQKYSGLLAIALSSGHITTGKKGKYHVVDMSTGEVGEEEYSAREINVAEVWDPILSDDSFKEFVRKRYQLGAAFNADIAEDDYDEAVYDEEE